MRRYYNKGGGADMGRHPLLKKLDKITSNIPTISKKLTEKQIEFLKKKFKTKPINPKNKLESGPMKGTPLKGKK